jgi:UDP-glucose:(heptosyl)LPS alpha-1,3-glucosyltransferase
MNEALAHMLNDDAVRRAWQANALAFANQADIYDNAEVAADVILKARP